MSATPREQEGRPLAGRRALHRPCPLCGGAEVVRVASLDLVQLEASPLPRSVDVVVCQRCDVGFSDTPAKQADYDAHDRSLASYAAADSTSGGQSPADQRRLRELAQRVIAGREDSEHLRVLDLGSGAGGLLRALAERGVEDCVGLDPDAAAVQLAASAGVLVVNGLVSTAAKVLVGQRFGVVVLSHVLEHLRDLEWSAQLPELLAPGGAVYVEVPDARRYEVGERPPGYYFDSEHINHFTPRSLARWGEVAGLVPVQCSEVDLPLLDGTSYPALAMFLVPGVDAREDVDGGADQALDVLLAGYAEASRRAVRERLVVSPPLHEEADLLVWGAGSFTQRLLGDGAIPLERVVAFVDSAPSRHGRTLAGLSVLPPAEALGRYPDAEVVVCVAVGSEAAARAIDLRTTAAVHTFGW